MSLLFGGVLSAGISSGEELSRAFIDVEDRFIVRDQRRKDRYVFDTGDRPLNLILRDTAV